MLAHLPPVPSSLLEVGCGTGELALALSAAGYRVVAIDPDAPNGEIDTGEVQATGFRYVGELAE